MKRKNRIAMAFALLIAGAVAWVVRASIDSPLFSLRQVEIEPSQEGVAMISLEHLRKAGLEIGRVSLFAIKLEDLEKKLLEDTQIESVHIEKRFPQTLYIRPTLRKPIARFLRENGALAWVDSQGFVYSSNRQGSAQDLAVIAGGQESEPESLQPALRILQAWSALEMDSVALLSLVRVQKDGDLALSVSFAKHRVDVILGGDSDFELETQLNRLKKVFAHLSKRDLTLRSIWANSGKKIVVKGSLGS